MTINELCDKYNHCYECPFSEICTYSQRATFWNNEEANIRVTNAIIETAKLLQEESNNDD